MSELRPEVGAELESRGRTLTESDLHREGFSDEIIAAVKLVTHDKDEQYADYVVRCEGNPIARQVKLADLEDNGRLDRTLLRPATLERDLRRIHRYNLSYKFLTGQISEQDYRAAARELGDRYRLAFDFRHHRVRRRADARGQEIGDVKHDKSEDDERKAPLQPTLVAPHAVEHGHVSRPFRKRKS